METIRRTKPKELDEICANCGCTKGAHHAGRDLWPYDYCPGHEGRMDWENGPSTVFKPSGKYKEDSKSRYTEKMQRHAENYGMGTKRFAEVIEEKEDEDDNRENT